MVAIRFKRKNQFLTIIGITFMLVSLTWMYDASVFIAAYDENSNDISKSKMNSMNRLLSQNSLNIINSEHIGPDKLKQMSLNLNLTNKKKQNIILQTPKPIITLTNKPFIEPTHPQNQSELHEDRFNLTSNELKYCQSIINNNKSTSPHFVEEDERNIKLNHRWPPYLISFGGSGNSYIRLIIEDITSIYSGSIYHEQVFNKLGFAKEQCIDNVIVVKAHTFHIMEKENIFYGRFLKRQCVCNCKQRIMRVNDFNHKNQLYHEKWLEYMIERDKNLTNISITKPALLPWMNVSAIFLIRDPWKAAWSSMQILHGDGYQDGVEVSETNVFHNIHTRHITYGHPKFSRINFIGTMMDYLRKEWSQTFRLMELFKENNFTFIVIKLEDFVNENERMATNEFDKLFGFLLNKKYFKENYNELRKRMECVNIIGEKHDRMRGIHRVKTNISDDGITQYMTIDDAYNEWSNRYLCIVWRRIRFRAIQYNYTMWPRYDNKGELINCSNLINMKSYF